MSIIAPESPANGNNHFLLQLDTDMTIELGAIKIGNEKQKRQISMTLRSIIAQGH